ncbi:MAG: hypothetical protein ABI577_10895 [bacterium]
MDEVTALMGVAFNLAHDISELSLNIEQYPELHGHSSYGTQIADAGVSALAHIACASATFAPDIHSRIEAGHSVSGARDSLHTLEHLVHTLIGNHYLAPERAQRLFDKIEQTRAILTALDAELFGAGLSHRRAS